MRGEKETVFQTGNKFQCKKSQKSHLKQQVRPPVTPVIDNIIPSNSVMLLRPMKTGRYFRPNSSGSTINEVNEYRLVHLSTMVRVYHDAMMSHRDFKNTYNGILVALADHELKRGPAVEEVF